MHFQWTLLLRKWPSFVFMEQIQHLPELGIVQIEAHNFAAVEWVELISAAQHHVSLKPQAAAAVKNAPFHEGYGIEI